MQTSNIRKPVLTSLMGAIGKSTAHAKQFSITQHVVSQCLVIEESLALRKDRAI